MSEVEKGPRSQFEFALTVGALSLLSGLLALANRLVVGEWPAEHGGVVALAFAVVGVLVVLGSLIR